MMKQQQTPIQQAAEAIENADAFLIAAGAGMGVDSGLPDFRGDDGFWKAYPPFRKLGLSFVEMANPQWYRRDPEVAWGFYGHRMNLYRATVPHAGFALLKKWTEQKPGGSFVFTSNVDGHFQRSGFAKESVMECHGSIHHAQCLDNCGAGIWSSLDYTVNIDEETFRAAQPLPLCPHCGSLARPNILMFGDFEWDEARTERQHHRFSEWIQSNNNRSIVIVEMGAGKAVPTVRHQCEMLQRHIGATLVRINPRESEGPAGTISIASGALAALTMIEEQLTSVAS